jgi:hypothetical protein
VPVRARRYGNQNPRTPHQLQAWSSKYISFISMKQQHPLQSIFKLYGQLDINEHKAFEALWQLDINEQNAYMLKLTIFKQLTFSQSIDFSITAVKDVRG